MKGCNNREGERKLSPSFFARNTVLVARDLLGCEIIRKVGAVRLRAKIVETEAYLEKGDPAAHCSRGPTPRAKIMFEHPGVIYVYFIYGNYFMLNFVTEKFGKAGAVLIRAIEPLEGIPKMAELRKVEACDNRLHGKRLHALTNGPAKLVLALGIDGSLNGKPVGTPELTLVRNPKNRPQEIVTTTRIGISVAKDLPLRFYIKGNPFVSKTG